MSSSSKEDVKEEIYKDVKDKKIDFYKKMYFQQDLNM